MERHDGQMPSPLDELEFEVELRSRLACNECLGAAQREARGQSGRGSQRGLRLAGGLAK